MTGAFRGRGVPGGTPQSAVLPPVLQVYSTHQRNAIPLQPCSGVSSLGFVFLCSSMFQKSKVWQNHVLCPSDTRRNGGGCMGVRALHSPPPRHQGICPPDHPLLDNFGHRNDLCLMKSFIMIEVDSLLPTITHDLLLGSDT